MSDKQNLINRLAAGERGNNIDVDIEIALFKPDKEYASVRANDAHSKLIYTRRDGTQQTCWAKDWSMVPNDAAQKLRASA